LRRPGVDGVLGTPDILEDLLLLGGLDDKVVIGSMSRGGRQGAVFELDDRFTGYDAATVASMGFDGGKMLTRIDPDDPATAATLSASGRAVSELASCGVMAMVEPFWCRRVDGRVVNDLSAPAVAKSVGVVSALGVTSAYAWWRDALTLPGVRGLVVGRALLYPPDGDVSGAVDAAVSLVRPALAPLGES